MACDDVVSALPCQDHNRCIDDVGGTGGAAKFSAGTGELFIERDNLDFVDPQKPRQCYLHAAIPPSLPHHTRRHSKGEALCQSPIEQSDQPLVATIQCD